MFSFKMFVTLKIGAFAPQLPIVCHTEHFRCLIVDVLPIISDWVFSLRKIFDQYELLKEKLKKSKEKETSRKKGGKRWFMVI